MRRRWLFLLLLPLWGIGEALRTRQAAELEPETGSAELLAPALMGGFKGLAVDLLWLRAVQLQEQQDFFELPFLFTLITELSPRLDTAWSHNAFNMAYNLPAYEGTPEGRWRWVRRGLLLTREGLRRNPRSIELRFAEAYTLWHLRERDLLSEGLDSEDRYAALFRADAELNPEGLTTSEAAYRSAIDTLMHVPGHTVRIDYVALFCVEEELARAVADQDRVRGRRWLREVQALNEHLVRAHPDQLEAFASTWERILFLAEQLPD